MSGVLGPAVVMTIFTVVASFHRKMSAMSAAVSAVVPVVRAGGSRWSAALARWWNIIAPVVIDSPATIAIATAISRVRMELHPASGPIHTFFTLDQNRGSRNRLF